MIWLKIEQKTIPIELEIKDYIGTYTPEGIEQYEGDYAIIPKVSEQKMQTKNKMMKDNVTIERIPFYEFSNDSGTTVVIGGIL
jgi:hypothetical protein